MASASGFGTPTPPQWTGVQTLVQNWLKSKSPEYQNFLAQQQKENEFRQHAQGLADVASANAAAMSEQDLKTKRFEQAQRERQFHLMTHVPDVSGSTQSQAGGAVGHDMYGNVVPAPESATTGHDVGQEQAPAPPQAGATLPRYNKFGQLNSATASDAEPTAFKNPQQPSSQATTTLPKSDKTETATPSTTSGNGFEANPYALANDFADRLIAPTTSGTKFSKPNRQIPSLKGDQKAANALPDVPSSSLPQPDSKSLGNTPRGSGSLPQATTAGAGAAAGDAGPSNPDNMPFGMHGAGSARTEPNVADKVRAASHDASTPWEQLTPTEQKNVINSYQTGAPSGTTISPTEAVRAYRLQQLARSGFAAPAGSAMFMKSYKIGPDGQPTVEYEYNPLAGEEGDEASPAGLELAGKVDSLNKAISGDENMKSAQNVIKAYGNMLHQAELAKTSHAPGVNDRTLAQLYLQTFLPAAKFNEATQELIGDTHGLIEAVKQPILHAMTGQTLSPEHREAILESARMNAQAAHAAATQSTAATRSLADVAIGHKRALKWLTQVPELPGTEVKGATGTSPHVGNGTVEGSAGAGQHKVLTPEVAQKFIQQAKGDNDRARQLARSAGYDL